MEGGGGAHHHWTACTCKPPALPRCHYLLRCWGLKDVSWRYDGKDQLTESHLGTWELKDAYNAYNNCEPTNRRCTEGSMWRLEIERYVNITS